MFHLVSSGHALKYNTNVIIYLFQIFIKCNRIDIPKKKKEKKKMQISKWYIKQYHQEYMIFLTERVFGEKFIHLSTLGFSDKNILSKYILHKNEEPK